MKKSVALLMAVLGMMLATAPPAPADSQGVAGSSGSLAEGETPPLPYELEKDGTLVIGGDVLIDCPSEFGVSERYADARPSDPDISADLEQNANAVRLCEGNGFSPSGVATDANHPPGTDDAALPRTGGAALLPLTAGLLLAGAAVAARRGTGS